MSGGPSAGPSRRGLTRTLGVLVGVALVVLAVVVLGRGAAGGGSATTVPDDRGTPAAGRSATAAARPSSAAERRDPQSGLPWVDVSALPREADATLALIDAGGPFPYAKDGSSFGNRERILPRRSSGYYREYTVPTPGSSDRGARRIIGGRSGERYWTADHYATFSRIRR